MSPVVTAERSLFWAGLALMVAYALVESSRRDLRRAKADLSAERNRRVGLEEDVDRLRHDLDAALDWVNEQRDKPNP